MTKYPKVGDVFMVAINPGLTCYFQYIGDDLSQLNMSIIRVFKKRYRINEQVNIDEITKDSVEFYAHITDLRLGEKNHIWVKVGKGKFFENLDNIYFRDPNGIMKSPICEKWFVWKPSGDRKLLNYSHRLVKIADIGIGIQPRHLISRLEFGVYSFVYPKYPGEK